MTSLDVLLQQVINGLMLGIMYSLVAVGFTLYFGVLDVINFAHGDFFMLGSFMALLLYAMAEAAGFAGNAFLLVAYLFISGSYLPPTPVLPGLGQWSWFCWSPSLWPPALTGSLLSL